MNSFEKAMQDYTALKVLQESNAEVYDAIVWHAKAYVKNMLDSIMTSKTNVNMDFKLLSSYLKRIKDERLNEYIDVINDLDLVATTNYIGICKGDCDRIIWRVCEFKDLLDEILYELQAE